MNLMAKAVRKEFLRAAHGTNRFIAVQDTDVTLAGGTLTVLTGRSGSGKTTLLNMLAGLLTPTAGEVLLDETSLYEMEDGALSKLRGTRFGCIPQGQTALHSLTVRENILLPFALCGGTPDEAHLQSLCETLGIASLLEARPAELSGGELRRAAIARALVHRPSVVLADEPTGDLDDENTATVFRLLRETAQQGAAVLVVTHETDAAQYADVLLRMDAGRLLQG